MFYIVYLTTNLVNNKTYVGKHRVVGDLFDDEYIGSGSMMLSAIKKYGKNNFKKDILAICTSEELAYLLEIEYIKLYREIGKCEYNIAIGGKGGQNGRKHTEDEKRKIGVASSEHWKREGYKENFRNKVKGRKRPRYFCEKISARLKGKNTGEHWYTNDIVNVRCEFCPDGFHPGRLISKTAVENWKKSYKPRVGWHHSEETKEKIRQKQKENPNKSMLGRHHSEETKRKMSLSRIGMLLSAETKEKLRQCNLGKHHGEETKRKMSLSKKGICIKNETKIKISNSKKGHIVSEETKLKISNSMKKRWLEGYYENRNKQES